jgi:hypothetical protein
MSNPNDAPIKWFNEKMMIQLEKPSNVEKDHWSEIPQSEIFQKIALNIAKVMKALIDDDCELVIAKCADIANLLMMLADNVRDTMEIRRQKMLDRRSENRDNK